MRNIALIVLAAGGSKRLGRPKQLVLWRGNSLLRHAVETALQTSCRPVVVVVGAEAERMEKEVAGLGATVVRNELWEEGMASSIRAGVEAIGEADGVVMMLCDQPFVAAEFLETLAVSDGIVGAEYGGSVGVPAFFPRKHFEALKALKGDTGAKAILRREGARGISSPDALIDIDSEESLKSLDQ